MQTKLEVTNTAVKPHRFLTLDALRGVAALTVIQFHLARFLGRNLFPHGQLAVDFFFMLSGFVLTFTYQPSLDREWPAWEFVKVRLIRLYPLYALGLLLGTASVLLQHLQRGKSSGSAIAQLFILGLFGIPATLVRSRALSAGEIYPLNRPSWSLFFEVVANILHAVLLRRRTILFLGIVLGATGLATVYGCHHFGSLDFGMAGASSAFGLARTVFSYTLGIVLFRVWQSGRFRPRMPPLACAVVLLLVLAGPPGESFSVPYDLFMGFIGLPLLVLASASSSPSPALTRPFQTIGSLSLPLYLIHMPLSLLFENCLDSFQIGRAISGPLLEIMFLVPLIAIAVLVDRCLDRPLRKYLTRRFVSPEPQAR